MSSDGDDRLPTTTTTMEMFLFAIIGEWPVDAQLDAQQLAHIAANVRQQQGFVRGYWGQEPDAVTSAHAVVILEDEGSAHAMAEGVMAAIPTASLRIVRVMAEA
jgi:hypothetical protein